jgi:tyrosinase
MNEHDGHHSHSHPTTFDEVLERGFPEHLLAEAWHTHRQTLTAAALGIAPRRIETTVESVAATVRKNQMELSDEERAAYRNAVSRLVDEGSYLELVNHHRDMSHNMHGTMGFVGLLRFLAWHRRYLVEFERELQRADRELRPQCAELLGVPYWRWPDPFPNWLDGFLPQNDPDSGEAAPPRKNGDPPEKSRTTDLPILLTGFAGQLSGVDVNDYIRFTYGLEGFGQRPDGSSLPAHNHGHAWIGGIMNNTRNSPTDPIFWLHHCEVDRLWHIWRLNHPDLHPPLDDANRILDPWPEAYDDVLNINALGYQFQSLNP